MRAGRRTALGLALIAAVALGAVASAHRRDEYLQAARLDVEPGRLALELDLTPGMAVADAIIAEIDRDRDGVLSADEKRAYLARVLDRVVLELDGRTLHLQPVDSTFPDLDAVRGGEGTIQIRSAVVLPRQADGDHQLVFRNLNGRDVSVYLANALAPLSDRITILAERRDATQHDLTIDYTLHAVATTSSSSSWLLGGLVAVAALLTAARGRGRAAGSRRSTTAARIAG